MAGNDILPVSQNVAVDVVAVEGMIVPPAVRQHLAFRDVHNTAGIVLQPVGIHDDGKRHARLGQRRGEVDGKPPLTEQGDAGVGRLRRPAVYGRHHRVAGQAGLHRRRCFHVPHLAHDYHVRREPQGGHHQLILRDVIGRGV